MAEVLITLGIIGVVAAMTLPALIQKHRRGVVETSLKRFYTTINQAINLSVVDNGETKYWVFPANNTGIEGFYDKYFKKYLKVLKTDVIDVDGVDYFTIYFADGSGSSLVYRGHDWIYCINAKDLPNFNDKNGIGCFRFGFYPAFNWVNPNSYSAKSFNNKGLEPHVNDAAKDGDGVVMVDDDGKHISTTEKDLYQQKCYAKIIQLNGWKIPEDYPLKF